MPGGQLDVVPRAVCGIWVHGGQYLGAGEEGEQVHRGVRGVWGYVQGRLEDSLGQNQESVLFMKQLDEEENSDKTEETKKKLR